MDFNKKILDNGLTVLTVPIHGLESVTLTVWVRTGSRNEDKKIGGISHFLEHMVFKGSKKRPTAREISEAVDAFGGEFNAATSKDWTNFYIKARKENLNKAFDVLSDMVLNPLLKAAEIEREKGTIIQEIAMYEDTPMMHIGDVFEELAFEGSPLGRDTAGTPESVRGIKREDFIKYRDLHYHPKEMLITVAGNFSEDMVESLIAKYFGNLPAASPARPPELFKSSQKDPGFKLQSKKSEQAHMILGFMGEGRGYKGRFAQSVLSVIMGAGMSSRLFIEVRERRGLAYSIRTSVDRYQETGYFGTYAGIDVKKADEAVELILDQHYGVVNGKLPISKAELAKAKEFLKGHLALALEDTKDVSSFFGEQALFLDEILTPEEVFEKVDRVTLDEVLSEATKLFVPSRLNLAIIGPYEDKNKFLKLLR